MPQALQCPRCQGSVSIADDAAGTRVKCPHCDQPFVAPGFAASKNDDDDWLSLDEPTAKPASKATPTGSAAPTGSPTPTGSATPAGKARPGTTRQPPNPSGPATAASSHPGSLPFDEDEAAFVIPESRPPKPSRSGSKLSQEDEALLAEFTGDLDDFTSQVDSPPPVGTFPAAARPAVSSFPAAGKPAPAPAPATPPAPAVPPAPAMPAVPKFQTEYRVSCNTCGSRMDVKATQAGKKVKCPDCYSPVLVPPPPRVKPKVEINLDEAPSFQFENNQLAERRPDPYTKSAAKLLEDAAREETINPVTKYEDEPDMVEWFKNVFGIFADPGVLMHWIALSVLASVPTYAFLSIDYPILRLAMIVGGFILGGVVVACGFAILQSVANDQDRVEEWPVFDPFAMLGQLFVALAAAGAVVIPVWMLCSFVFGQTLISVAITMLAVYSLFPFVLLSMLDMGSPLVPFSPEVARSVSKCQESWGGFYLSSGLLFAALFLFFATTSSVGTPAGAVFAITAGIGIAFTYFAMIGRLAYAIGQAVNAPPMENDIDRTRKSDSI